MGKLEWISPDEAARIIGVSRSTVYRSLQPERADVEWGPGNWRKKPLSQRGDLQVLRSRAHEIAKGGSPLASEGGEPPEQ